MIIGFVGLAGSGKGTCGDYLVDEYGFKAESFAAPLKDACAAIFGWDRKLLEGDTTTSRSWRAERDAYWSEALGLEITPRYMLQRMGTEVMRNNVNDNIWVLSLFSRVDENKDYVITDVRFENEIDAIRSRGGKIVYVERHLENWQHAALECKRTGTKDITVLNQFRSDLPAIHISEWDWIDSDFDYEILNYSDILTLSKNLDIMVSQFKGELNEIKPRNVFHSK